ncbi:disulfide oxidoreductase [Alkalihalobacterium chitinilyticum]|uniref:Probable disulfide formation protein n=1 Tax=Alkalihalobacterium chitinilyticum TaxID=2980103 RepID=A0ABT5VAI4_9BACI|nr:disulfide oxidoreductase [Alkalihalobacterium chitinilyticum]MDE5412489.1 disulfide oxidoreductase [Alkalihalobacterium chitinilyticum]
MKNNIKQNENLLFAAWGVSLIATIGSLYFSEILSFIPCELCWYQRIFMYPIVIILGIAVVKKDTKQALYSAVFSGIGLIIAFYHYLVQKVPAMTKLDSCGLIPCASQYINWFGFITIPFLALVGFTIIFVISVVILKTNQGR